jgi:hypothetical protein
MRFVPLIVKLALVSGILAIPPTSSAHSPRPVPPPPGWDKCKGTPLDLSAESIYSTAIQEYERQNGRLVPDKHRIEISPNGCAWWVTIELVPRDTRGKFGVVIDKVTGRQSWSGWIDV